MLYEFVDSVKNMPQRMTVYTTLVGLLNAKNYNAGGDVKCSPDYLCSRNHEFLLTLFI